MPFQSEKQRRYLHANHPEIAKRWERDYANGGISNHFKLKDGGNIRLQPHTATDLLAKKNPDGTRSKYQPPGGGETSLGSGAAHSGGGGGYQNVHQTGAISQTPGNIPTLATSGGGDGPKPHSGPSFAEIEAQKRAALEKKKLAAWEHSQTLKKTKTDRAKKTKYLKGLLKNDPLYETYVDKGLLDWENIKGYESDPQLKTDESLKAKQKGWWGYTKPWLGGGENLYISNLEEFGQEPKGPLHATRSGRWNETIAEKNKRIAETIGHEARHQVLGADEPAMFGDPYSQKVNEALYPQGFVDEETFNLPGKGTHELINTMGDFQAYNNPEIYGDIYGTIHGDMPRHLSSPVADQLYDASTQFTKDTKARRELSDVYEPRDYTGRAVKGNESTARLSKTQKKELVPSKMYGSSVMEEAYEKAQNMNANQFKAWAKKEGQTGKYIDKLSSALDYNETSAGTLHMIGIKDATKMIDLPGWGDDEKEVEKAAVTLLEKVKTSANKEEWTGKSNVKSDLANDFYKDKEKYKQLGIDNPDDLKAFIDVVYNSVKVRAYSQGGVARKNYFHGGILDIDTSEEIISDDGNDIELTDYNAAFDEPTGVKSLFQAKDGGRIGFRRGTSGAPGGGDPGMYSAPSSTGGNGGGPYEDPDPGQDKVAGDIQFTQYTDKPSMADYRTKGFADLWGKYDTKPTYLGEELEEEYIGPRLTKEEKKILTTKTKEYIQRNLKKLDPDKYYETMSLWDKAWDFEMPPMGAVGILMAMYKEHKLTKEGKGLLEEWGKFVGGPPGSNPEAYDALWLALEKRKAKYRKDDDPKGEEGPAPIYAPLTGAVSEEYAQGDYGGSLLDRDNAALYAQLSEKWRQEKLDKEQEYRDYGLLPDNPIVMEANSGGLANLFRVKNQ